MGRLGVELLLVCFALVTVLGFIITYSMAVVLDHVTPFFPYISDTGGKPPESCVFSLICNVAVIFEVLIVYIRYKGINHLYERQDEVAMPTKMKCLNIFGFIVGLVSGFGFLLVANFQDDNVLTVHYIGAFTVFSAGNVYLWIQTHLTVQIHKSEVLRCWSVGWLVVQIILCVLSAIFFIGVIVFMNLSFKHRTNKPEDDKGTFIWTPDQGGYTLHVLSTACEWGLTFTFLLFFLTFHPHFKELKMNITVLTRLYPGQTRHHEYVPIGGDEAKPLLNSGGGGGARSRGNK